VDAGEGSAQGVSRDPILLVTGPPGAGKTTTARVLADHAERPAVHLEADPFFRFVRRGYVEPWKPDSHEQNRVVMQIVARATIGYADAGYFTVLDGAVMPRRFLGPVRDWLRAGGHDVAYAILRPSLETSVARAMRRGVEEGADREVLERLWREFADLGPLERHVVDTGELAPEEVAALVEKRLREGAILAP
jgi:chloramphenicol 3-O-phosphotransferase